jgi:hypothetical protein
MGLLFIFCRTRSLGCPPAHYFLRTAERRPQ